MIINQVVKGGGTTPTGTIQITTNGTHDVTNYASADVQVPTTAPAHYIEKTVDANGVLQNTSTMINLTGVTSLGDFVLAYAYKNIVFPQNTSLDFSGITTLTAEGCLQYAFNNCRNIISVDFSSLTSVSGSSAFNYAFCNEIQLTSVDFGSLETVSGSNAFMQAFAYCGNLTSADFSSLTTVSGNSSLSNMFSSCENLVSMSFDSLTNVSGTTPLAGLFSNCQRLKTAKFNKLNVIQSQICPSYATMFQNCYALESVEFGGLTASTFSSLVNQLRYLFYNTTGQAAPNGCTIHFPSNFDPSDPNHTFDASTLTGYPTFNGDANYIHVAFDLPATE